jgi:hypothetical protein
MMDNGTRQKIHHTAENIQQMFMLQGFYNIIEFVFTDSNACNNIPMASSLNTSNHSNLLHTLRGMGPGDKLKAS